MEVKELSLTVTSHFPGRREILVILSLTCYPEYKKDTWHKPYLQLFSLFILNLNLNLDIGIID